MSEKFESIELVSECCEHLDCMYRSQIYGGFIPICYYAVIEGHSRECRISECDKYKAGEPKIPRMAKDYVICWEYGLYDEYADIIW